MRKKSFLLLELFIWILLLGGLTLIVINTVKNHLDSFNTYQVEFKDVDSLIVGSPVRIMGIDVGHVTNVQPIGNRVYITFKITNKQVYIPADSNVSVQFTGLAGSKSLEIAPPKSKTEASVPLKTIEPVRINSLIGLQAEICQSALESSRSVLKMLKMGDVNSIRQNFKDFSKTSNDLTYTFKTKKTAISDTNKVIKTNLDYSQKSLSQLNTNIDIFSNIMKTNKLNKKSEVLKSANNIQYFANYIQVQADSRSKIMEETRRFQKNVDTMDKKLNKLNNKEQAAKKIQRTDNILNNLNNLSDFFINVFNPRNINKMQDQSLKLKNNTLKAKDNI
jgi:hypothetical protein